MVWRRVFPLLLCLSLLAPAAGIKAQRPSAVASPPTHMNAALASLWLLSMLNIQQCAWHDGDLRDRELQIAARIWKRNVSRLYALVHPSGAYSGVWLRDSFWTFTAVGDPQLAGRALQRFAARQSHTGQLPTQFTNFLRGPIYRPDESTLLFLIWAGWQQREGGPIPPVVTLRAALAYVRSRAPEGLYRSQEGSYASWFDSWVLRQPDTLSYNQGLYAVALLAARYLGLNVPKAEVDHAIADYRGLVDQHGGYVRFSRLLNHHDASGLVGEFLALWLFGRPLLSDQVVGRTLDSLARFESGFRVVTDAQGGYLPPHAFLLRSLPGDYQNGGSWLLYDYIALGAGFLHHLPGMGQRMHDRLALEFIPGATFHEYLNTNPQSRLYGHEPRYRDNFSWDTFVIRVDAVTCGGS